MSQAITFSGERSAQQSSQSERLTLSQAFNDFLNRPVASFYSGFLVAAGACRLALGGWGWGDLVAVTLLALAWPVQEALVHRFLLHWRPLVILGYTLDFKVAQDHRAHHEQPDVIDHVNPGRTELAGAAALMCLVWWLFAPTLEIALTGIWVHAAMGGFYEWVHYLIHTSYRPKSGLYRRLWRNHRLHHYKNEHYWYGVTRLEGDILMGTNKRKGDVPTSPTCRNIVGDTNTEC